MPLFDNRQAVNLRACEQMVEAVLVQMGIDLAQSRVPGEVLSWSLSCGSAHLLVSLHRDGQSDENFIHVIAPVLRPRAEDPALWRRLLELNSTTLKGGAFALRDGDVVVTAERSTLGLDRVEIEEMLRRVGEYADRFDDQLVAEFGGTRHCDLPTETESSAV